MDNNQAKVAAILVERNVARRLKSRAWLNKYICPECGDEKITTSSNANRCPLCSKCGKIQGGVKHRTHGKTINRQIHPVFRAWVAIKERCCNPKRAVYQYYGGIGITVCDEWLKSSDKFIEWSLSNGWSKGLEIDRINTWGNYEPSNCRWITRKENCRNKKNVTLNRQSVKVIHRLLDSKEMMVKEIATIFGCSPANISNISKGNIWNDVYHEHIQAVTK